MRHCGQRRDRLSAHEAAVVLERPVRDVRNMLRRGELSDVRRGRLRAIAAAEVRELVADRPLAGAILAAILDGRLQVEPLALDEHPPPLMESWDALW